MIGHEVYFFINFLSTFLPFRDGSLCTWRRSSAMNPFDADVDSTDTVLPRDHPLRRLSAWPNLCVCVLTLRALRRISRPISWLLMWAGGGLTGRHRPLLLEKSATAAERNASAERPYV